ncbi:MAG: hypothetical protein WAZ14_00315 [Patescibacteria group bacterium]
MSKPPPFNLYAPTSCNLDPSLARHLQVARASQVASQAFDWQALIIKLQCSVRPVLKTASWLLLASIILTAEVTLSTALTAGSIYGLVAFMCLLAGWDEHPKTLVFKQASQSMLATIVQPLASGIQLFNIATYKFKAPPVMVTTLSGTSRLKTDSIWTDEVCQDPRFGEYLLLLEFMQAWSDLASTLNRLIMSAEDQVLPGVVAKFILDHRATLELKELQLRSFIKHCTALATLGEPGAVAPETHQPLFGQAEAVHKHLASLRRINSEAQSLLADMVRNGKY